MKTEQMREKALERAVVMASQLGRDKRLRSLAMDEIVSVCFETIAGDMAHHKWGGCVPENYFQLCWRNLLARARTGLLESLGWKCKRLWTAGKKNGVPRRVQWTRPCGPAASGVEGN